MIERGLWWRIVASVVAGVLVAGLLVYKPSFSRPGLSPRVRSFGVAQTQVLVDAAESPLADVTVLTDDVANLAENLAAVVPSPAILGQVAASLGVPARDIGVTVQDVQNVPLNTSYQQQAQSADSILTDERNYSILLRVDQASFVIQIFTQAPTGAKAVQLANETASTLSSYVRNLVVTERVRRSRQVILRPIGPAYGGTVDGSITVEAFVALALVTFTLSLLGFSWIRRVSGRRTPAAGPVHPAA